MTISLLSDTKQRVPWTVEVNGTRASIRWSAATTGGFTHVTIRAWRPLSTRDQAEIEQWVQKQWPLESGTACFKFVYATGPV